MYRLFLDFAWGWSYLVVRLLFKVSCGVLHSAGCSVEGVDVDALIVHAIGWIDLGLEPDLLTVAQRSQCHHVLGVDDVILGAFVWPG